MTLQQLRYVIDISKTGSITKSAANLFITQPNLSIALRELEAELGITVFVRNAKGTNVTPEGEEFLRYAKSVISQIDHMQFVFRDQKQQAVAFTIAYTRSSHITKLLCEFQNSLPRDAMLNLQLIETSSQKAFDAVANSEADIARVLIIKERYSEFKRFASKNGLIMDLLWNLKTYIMLSVNHPLADVEELHPDMLKDYTRVRYTDVEVDIVPVRGIKRTISVNDRGTLMDILANCPDCYLWTAATHSYVLQAHNLALKPCADAPMLIEALVYPKDKSRTREFKWMLERLKSLQYEEYVQSQEPFDPENVM